MNYLKAGVSFTFAPLTLSEVLHIQCLFVPCFQFVEEQQIPKHLPSASQEQALPQDHCPEVSAACVRVHGVMMMG